MSFVLIVVRKSKSNLGMDIDMGEENDILGFGKAGIFFAPKVTVDFKPLEFMENSTEFDRIKVRDTALSEPLKIEPLSVQYDMPSEDIENLLDMSMDVAKDPAFATCSLVVEGKPRINRPKNLKYPNKKRARRIWKKWTKRFGTTPSRHTVIPKAILSVTPAFRNNQAYYEIEAVVEKGDLNTKCSEIQRQ